MNAVGALGLFVALALAPAARADPPEVGVVAGAAAEPIARRLAAELRGRGYRVRTVALPIEADRFAELEGLDASAWVEDAPPRVRVCVLASERPCEALADAEVAVLLIRAVESLRAQLDDPSGEASAEPPAPEPPPRAPPPPPPPPPAHRWSLAVAGSAVLPTSSLSTGAGAAVVLAWSPDPWLGLELGGFADLIAPEVSDARGVAVVDARMAWIGASLRIPETVLGGHHLLIGGAAGVAGVDVRASAAPPFAARSTSLASAMLLAHVTLVVHVIDRLELLIGVRAGSALPQPVLLFGGDEIARWGAPFVALELGAAADLTSPARSFGWRAPPRARPSSAALLTGRRSPSPLPGERGAAPLGAP